MKKYVLVSNSTDHYVADDLVSFVANLRKACLFNTKQEAEEEKECGGAERVVPVVMKNGHPVLDK